MKILFARQNGKSLMTYKKIERKIKRNRRRIMMKDILTIIGRTLLLTVAITGIIGFFNMINYERKIDNLEKQIENQTMLIEILKRSCE